MKNENWGKEIALGKLITLHVQSLGWIMEDARLLFGEDWTLIEEHGGGWERVSWPAGKHRGGRVFRWYQEWWMGVVARWAPRPTGTASNNHQTLLFLQPWYSHNTYIDCINQSGYMWYREDFIWFLSIIRLSPPQSIHSLLLPNLCW